MAYFLDKAAGKPHDEDHEAEAFGFVQSANISADWILSRRIDVMLMTAVMGERERNAVTR